ncbi:MAG: aminotransferase class III-fold pyridoxal phosphate-dependent enzyme, partial [Thermomicrobiales bacterium]
AHARARKSMPNGFPMSWFKSLYDHGPLFVAEGAGAYFTDLDGHRYLDVNLADMSQFCGFAPPAVTAAVARRAAQGVQFLLPTEDAAWVAEELGRRYGLPQWQFTLSATTANVEAMRLARVATGRAVVVMFDGKYHGHAEEMLFAPDGDGFAPEGIGLDMALTHRLRLIPFNDVAALAAALAPGDVACVVTEPALTNAGVILPEPGFHAALRRLTRDHRALLLIDETHTQVCGPGGLTGRWQLSPDLVTLGKSVAGGIPFGAYGMTDELAGIFAQPDPEDTHAEIASGGTLFGNALSLAAARAAMGEVLTTEAYARTAALGAELADGIERVCAGAGLGWRAHRLYARTGYAHAGALPRNAAEATMGQRRDIVDLQRVYFANRGIWEAIYSAGPCVGVAHTSEDVAFYLQVLGEFVGELVA